MGFFSRLVSSSEMAEHKEEKNSAAARDKWIKLQKKIYPSRSIESIAAEYDASLENSPRARDKRLYEEDKQYWEDIAAGKIPKETPLPSKAYFDSLTPQEQQAETNRKQQNFQASQIRAHNSRVESLTKDIQNNIALYGKNNANTVFMETELKKLTAQQPVFAPISAAPIVNVTIAAPSAPQNTPDELLDSGNDDLWEKAAAELESGERKEALWIKCFSQAGGDENKAKALYYAARVEQLSLNNEPPKPSAEKTDSVTQNKEVLLDYSQSLDTAATLIADSNGRPSASSQKISNPLEASKLKKSSDDNPSSAETKKSTSSIFIFGGLLVLGFAAWMIIGTPSKSSSSAQVSNGNVAIGSGEWSIVIAEFGSSPEAKKRTIELSKELNGLNIIKTKPSQSGDFYIVACDLMFDSEKSAQDAAQKLEARFASQGYRMDINPIKINNKK